MKGPLANNNFASGVSLFATSTADQTMAGRPCLTFKKWCV